MNARRAVGEEPRLARVAALVADASRSRMLCHLLGGELASAGELAHAAGVGAATASAHLQRLLDSGLLACEPRGRHRYYRLADADVAHALEALALVAERGTHERQWSGPARLRLRAARCCYGHLAGRLGVALLTQAVAHDWLEPGSGLRYRVTPAGARQLSALGLDGEHWRRRSAVDDAAAVAYGCLDWSERRDHLAGALARALREHFEASGWVRRRAGERAVQVTPAGRHALRPWLGDEALLQPA